MSDPAQLSLFQVAAPRPAPPASRSQPETEIQEEDGPSTQERPTRAQTAPQHLFARLSPHFGSRLRHLVVTRNRSRILSCTPDREDPQGLRLRLDVAFTEAPNEILMAIATWALQAGSARRHALRHIRQYFQQYSRDSPPRAARPSRRIRLDPVGQTYDLRVIAAEINSKYFAGLIRTEISWGKTLPGGAVRSQWQRLWQELRGPSSGRPVHLRQRARRKSIRLGSYSYRTGVIRIHRALDDPSIPRYVVASVVHHEMLHAHLPQPEPAGVPGKNGAPGQRGRRRIHTPEFRRLEAQFEDHERAQGWLRKNLGMLLTC